MRDDVELLLGDSILSPLLNVVHDELSNKLIGVVATFTSLQLSLEGIYSPVLVWPESEAHRVLLVPNDLISVVVALARFSGESLLDLA